MSDREALGEDRPNVLQTVVRVYYKRLIPMLGMIRD
jgi:hypothetical protein